VGRNHELYSKVGEVPSREWWKSGDGVAPGFHNQQDCRKFRVSAGMMREGVSHAHQRLSGLGDYAMLTHTTKTELVPEYRLLVFAIVSSSRQGDTSLSSCPKSGDRLTQPIAQPVALVA
jgi:hypothetical protein